MSRRIRKGQCVYCGENGQITSDHVPPKTFFPPNRRVNLLTVNACPKCHDTFKLDDEYFRFAISIRDDLPPGPDAQFLRDSTKRTLKDVGAPGLRAHVAKSIIRVPVRNSVGHHLGERLAMFIDGERLKRSSLRIIKALYAKRFGRIIPRSYTVDVCLYDLQRDETALLDQDVQDVLATLGNNGSHTKIGEVFEYWFSNTIDDKDSSVWFCKLHGAFAFIGWTWPKSAEDA